MGSTSVSILLVRAVDEARLAYEFSPGSYTYGAYVACMRAVDEITAPDWIAEFNAYHRSLAV